jgi:DNA polymerase III alpha subunit
MRTDIYGQLIFNENDLVNLYYTDPNLQLKNVLVEDEIKFDQSLELENLPTLIKYTLNTMSVSEFDTCLQNNWFMPKRYYDMDIAQFVLDQCKTDSELQRAGHELLMYQEKNMFNLLKYLKYLVDTMRDNNIVWGVGRGSSVASFVLFLMGVHKINSLYYDIPIEEFLK